MTELPIPNEHGELCCPHCTHELTLIVLDGEPRVVRRGHVVLDLHADDSLHCWRCCTSWWLDKLPIGATSPP